MKRSAFAILFASLLITEASAQKKQEITFADVTIYIEHGTYYLTGTRGNKKPLGFSILQSKDLETWTIPDGIGPPGLILTKGNQTWGTKGFWAPQIFKEDDTYYLTYTADEQTALAESKSLFGPYTQKKIAPIDGSEKNIDSYIFKDDDGKHYLYSVRFNNGNYLWVAEFDLKKGEIKKGTLKQCFKQTDAWEATPNYKSSPIMEGPSVFKLRGKYYLFYSANHYMNVDYAVGYAVADTPYGPWVKNKGNPIIHRAIVGENGSGHGDIFEGLDCRLYYVYHIHSTQSEVHPRKTRVLALEKEWDQATHTYNFSVEDKSVIAPMMEVKE